MFPALAVGVRYPLEQTLEHKSVAHLQAERPGLVVLRLLLLIQLHDVGEGHETFVQQHILETAHHLLSRGSALLQIHIPAPRQPGFELQGVLKATCHLQRKLLLASLLGLFCNSLSERLQALKQGLVPHPQQHLHCKISPPLLSHQLAPPEPHGVHPRQRDPSQISAHESFHLGHPGKHSLVVVLARQPPTCQCLDSRGCRRSLPVLLLAERKQYSSLGHA